MHAFFQTELIKVRRLSQRGHYDKETHTTTIVAIDIETASAKIRNSPAKDDRWPVNMSVPEYIKSYRQ